MRVILGCFSMILFGIPSAACIISLIFFHNQMSKLRFWVLLVIGTILFIKCVLDLISYKDLPED